MAASAGKLDVLTRVEIKVTEDWAATFGPRGRKESGFLRIPVDVSKVRPLPGASGPEYADRKCVALIGRLRAASGSGYHYVFWGVYDNAGVLEDGSAAVKDEKARGDAKALQEKFAKCVANCAQFVCKLSEDALPADAVAELHKRLVPVHPKDERHTKFSLTHVYSKW